MFSFFGAFSQDFKNEEDRKKHADKLFDKGKYVEAAPHILHFLSLNQTSPEYNFKYGVCLMYSDEDKEKSLRYLKFSASKGGGGDSRVYFFLGKSLHLNYNFKAALTNYNKFKLEGEEGFKKSLEVDLHIEMCKNGKQLLKNLTELVVYEKTESSFERFQYSYDLKEIGGKILVSSEFQSKYDKKVGYKSVVYFPPLNQDVLFFSSYGKDGSTGLDLYLVRRGASGGFGSPEKLPETINTPYDDAYGFLHADGKTFYFSSKGHNSMGGYDVFKANYTSETNRFEIPKNLDYKINTPDDDIMYIVDPDFQNAYFSSSRAAKGGFLDVYKVKVETFPIINVILAGKFENKIKPEDNAATIKVENIQSGEIEGIYNPDNAGNYVIVLPRSGKYKLIVETPESQKIHTGMIDVPAQKVMRPLKQTLDLVDDGGIEKLVINNLFDQEVENGDAILAKVLKAMSDPDPNADEFPDSLYNTVVDQENLVTEALDQNYSVDDLIGLSADKAKEVQEEADELKKRMEAAYTVANNKSNEAKALTLKADKTLKEIEENSNPLEKQDKIESAKKAHAQSKDLNMLATTALNLANALKVEYDKKQVEATDAKNVAIGIEKAINENSHDKAIAALKELQSRIDDLVDDRPGYKSGFDEIVQKAKLKQEEADNANLEAQQYREADNDLNLRLNNLERDLAKAKNKDKPLIQRQIEDIKEQFELNDELAKESFEKSATLQGEADLLNHQVDLMTNLFNDIDAGTTVELSESEKQQVRDYLESNELSDNITRNENSLSQHNGISNPEELSNTGTDNNTVETNVILTEVEKDAIVLNEAKKYKDFDDQLSTIIGDEEAKENIEKEKEINENWLEKITTDIDDTKIEIANETIQKEKLELETKLDWLAEQKTAREDEIATLTDEIAAIDNVNSNPENEIVNNEESKTTEITAEEKKLLIEEEVKKYASYNDKLNNIENTGTQLEQITAKKQINEDWITALDGEIMDAEDQLALATSDNEKQSTETKINWLNEQKTQKETELIGLSQEIAAIESSTLSTENEFSELTIEEKNTIIEAEEKNYTSFEEKLKNIEVTGSEKEVATAKKQVNEEWITSLDEQILDTEDQVDSELEGKDKLEAETKLAWLNEQKSIRQTTINQLDDEIAIATTEENTIESNSVNTTDNNVLSTSEKEELIAREKESFISFESEIASIGDNPDELEQKSTITENWLTALNTQLIKTNNEIESTTNTKEKLALETKINWLTEQQEEKKAKLNEYTEAIAANNSENTINETEFTTENVKAEDWLTIIDNDINELDRKIKIEDNEETKTDLIVQKEKLVKLREEKLNLVNENNNIIVKSEEQKKLEETLAYKELAEEIGNTLFTPRDFENSFTTDLDYSSDKAKELILENSTGIEEILVIEQEIVQLENELEETKKDKKRAAIITQIENKEEKKTEIELAISENIIAIDEAEFTKNQKDLEVLVSEAKVLNNPIIKDQNYQTAKLLEVKYIEQNNNAKQLIKEASFIENKNKKAEKLKIAHTEQQSAIQNQKEAKILLDEMILEDYAPTLIEDEESLVVDNNIDNITPQAEFISKDYLPNQKVSAYKLEEQYNTIPEDEKSSFLADWKEDVDIEVIKNMKMLISDIPEEDKEIVNNNISYLRTEQQKIETLQNDLEEIVVVEEIPNNNTVIVDTVENSLVTNTVIDNTEGVSETNITESNTEESNTEETNTAETNTIEENTISNNEETKIDTILNDNTLSTVEGLSTQKEVFENYSNTLESLNSNEEKETLFNDWIGKLDDEITINEKAIEGNITVDEELIIQSKIDWLKTERLEKIEALAELESNELANNSVKAEENSNEVVSQEIKEKSKFKNEVAGITFYSANEELSNFEVSTNVPTKDLTTQIDFNSTKGTELIIENESGISKVKNYETALTALELQKTESNDEKTSLKIDKKLNKTSIKKSKAELKLADDFKEATEEDYNLASAKLSETKSLLTNDIDENSYAFKQAKEFEVKAEDLKNEANQLRNEAAGMSSAIEQNDLTNEALSKEKASIEYTNKASKLYSEAIVNNYKVEEDAITTVSENEEERKSSLIAKAAKNADNLAYEYNTRAGELRDSAITVKKKNRSKVISEAEVFTQKSEAQKSIANELDKEANIVQEQEELVLQNEMLLTNLTESDVENVRSAENYDKIYNNQQAIEAFLKELREEEERMKSYLNLAKQQENKALEFEEKAKNTNSEEEKNTFIAIAEKLQEKANNNKKSKDSVSAIINEINNNILTVEEEQVDLLSLFDEEMQNDIRGLFLSNYEKAPKKKVVKEPTSLTMDNLLSTNFEAPEELNENIVVINNDRNSSVYSDSNPIPLNPKNPLGLVYKVQVGAFRNPIPQDLFKGFAPISAEKINDNITRYRVGYFVNFETANVSKNQIRKIGYPDAFVVAIINGKRVSMAEARAFIQNPNTFITEVDNESNNESTTTNNIEVETETENTVDNNETVINEGTTEENNLDNETEVIPDYVQNLDENAAEVTAVENIKGLFYTVQVGAFSKPIAKTGVFNISPLVTKYVNGLYKYTTGIYKSVQNADGRKMEVRAKGIPDAFVIAYYNGERVTLIEASKIIQEQGEGAFARKAEGSNTETVNNNTNIEESSQLNDNNDRLNENTTTREVSMYALPSYLASQKSNSITIAEELKIASLSEKKTIIVKRKMDLDNEITNNMKLLVSDIPDVEKEVINENILWLRAEKAKNTENGERLEDVEVLETPNPENTSVETSEVNEDKKSTFYIDLGIYYGTVPTAIAEALLTNKKAKVKRNRINASATQYYCGVFLTKEEVTEIWSSFVQKGIKDANIVEIRHDQKFILLEDDKRGEAVEDNPEEEVDQTVTTVNTKLVYRVELGTFEGVIPVEIGRVFLELGYLGIEKVISNNKETYYCGKVDSETKANELKERFLEKGINDAKTVAFVGERKISLEEAKELSK